MAGVYIVDGSPFSDRVLVCFIADRDWIEDNLMKMMILIGLLLVTCALIHRPRKGFPVSSILRKTIQILMNRSQ